MTGLPKGFSEIRGQEGAKRALEIAVAGGHHALVVGPSGAGKTSLARGLSSILPPPPENLREEIECIYNLAGLKAPGETPVRVPLVALSPSAMVGRCRPLHPGEASLAHGGVLVLDEVHTFRRDSLEALLGPLDLGEVVLPSAPGGALPSRFTLAATGTLCPCGNQGNYTRPCSRTPAAVRRHWRQIPVALIGRLALQVEVPSLELAELRSGPSEKDAEIRERVSWVWKKQWERSGALNGTLRPRELDEVAALDRATSEILVSSCRRLGLSAQARDQLRQVARTIADMNGSDRVRAPHLLEAIQYRVRDRRSITGVTSADPDSAAL